MLEYLLNYGIKKVNIDYEDLDVNDRLRLQDQINSVRKNYNKLLNLLDEVQDKYLDCSYNINKRTKDLINENNGIKNNSLFTSDEDYLAFEAQLEAFKIGIQMINSQIEYCKNDLRILNSVFYNKF